MASSSSFDFAIRHRFLDAEDRMVDGECVDLAEAIQGGHRGNRTKRGRRSCRGFANDLLAGLGIPTADRHAPHDLRVRGPRRKGRQPQGSDRTLGAEHEIKARVGVELRGGKEQLGVFAPDPVSDCPRAAQDELEVRLVVW
jgi:hypothetical protein